MVKLVAEGDRGAMRHFVFVWKEGNEDRAFCDRALNRRYRPFVITGK